MGTTIFILLWLVLSTNTDEQDKGQPLVYYSIDGFNTVAAT